MKIAVAALGHSEVEDSLSAAQAKVQRCNRPLLGVLSNCRANYEWGLRVSTVKTKVGELRRGVRKDSRIENETTLPGALRLDGALKTKKPDLRRSRDHGQQNQSGAKLHRHWPCWRAV